MTNLYASVIHLFALSEGVVSPPELGRWGNAAFYGLLGKVDNDMATKLHRYDGRKPFTVSLSGLPHHKNRPLLIREGDSLWLRITTLGDTLFRPFGEYWLSRLGTPKLRLGAVAFGVREVLNHPDSHEWAGFVASDELARAGNPRPRMTLSFATPTRFNFGAKDAPEQHLMLFPAPAAVFGSLATKWAAFVDGEFDWRYVETLAAGVRVSDYRLHVEAHPAVPGDRGRGFMGQVTYDLKGVDRAHWPLFWQLAAFAFYAGVGGKTTHGMGQSRLEVRR